MTELAACTITSWGYDGSAFCVDTATGAIVGEWVPIPGEAEGRLDFLTPAQMLAWWAQR